MHCCGKRKGAGKKRMGPILHFLILSLEKILIVPCPNSLIEAVHIYKDLSCLIGPVVKLLPSHNEEVKKASYKVLPKICASHPEIAVLVVNTIKKDCNDPNPVVKCLAVSTLCSLLPLIEEHATHVLGVALDDDNPNVRQTAVLGCVQVFKSMPLLLQEQGFIDRLYSCIRDIDPRVVTSSLLALDTILAHEGGVVVNKSITFHLLQRLGEFPNSLLATVLQVLKKYKPCEENERFQELNECQPFLQRFQTSKPMTPYLFEAVEKLLRYLMNRCVKPDLMKCTGARKCCHEYLETKKKGRSEEDKKKSEKRKLDLQVKDIEGKRKKLMMATEEKREAIEVELQELKKKQASPY
uniref:Clathrin/coatomer adaptor adaptin-like N-terminal domain-containing protein n=1 Tax=Timema monikensis TaxID=170555 RepID=A0A7R9HS07_9NEOP|nr:unnamed protein product [Timema monikensis]